MYTLKDKTKDMASFTIGIDMEKFVNLDFDDEIVYINRYGQTKCAFLPEDDDRISGRGNPLLARNEFLTMDEVDKELGGKEM